jgi:hypothetical protein
MFDILVTQDLHPPLYYLALHGWMRVAGQGEFAARFVSVIAGVPSVPATYVLGASLFRDKARQALPSTNADRGVQIGLLGATLVALSPFLVYYSQEARMYSALATFGLLSTVALWKLLETPSRFWFISYVALTLAVMYTQYFGSFVIAFQGIYLLGIATRARRRALLGLLGIVAVGIGYLPWVYGAYRQIQRLIAIPDFWKGDFQLSYMLTHLFAAFAIGQFTALEQMPVIAVAAAILLFVGMGFLAWRALRNGGGELFVLTYLIIPLALLYEVVVRDPKFTERYLIMIAPPFYLVLALAIVSVGRWLRRARWRRVRQASLALTALVTVGLIVVSITQLLQVYNGPGYRKDDNRGAIQYIETHAQPGDVTMLMMNTYQSYIYYSNGTVPYAPLQPGDRIQDAAAGLNQLTAGHKRLWVFLWNPEWADPTNWVRQSLNRAYRRLPVDQQFSGLGLELYEIDPRYSFSVKTTPDVTEAVNFGNKLRLHGFDLAEKTIESGRGGRITLYWDVPVVPTNDYIVSLRLTDGRFYWWRHDDRPAAFNYPTNYWRPAQIVAGQRDFEVPPGTPPGTYYLEVGVYGQGIGSDLDVLQDGSAPAGTTARVATIVVTSPATSPDVASLAIPNRTDSKANDVVRLLGSSVQTARVLPGGAVDLTIWWQALKRPTLDYDVRVTATSGSVSQVVSLEPPASGTYPTNRWTENELVVDKHRLIVPLGMPPGLATLTVQLVPHGATTGQGSPITLKVGTADVLDRQIVKVPPSDVQSPANFKLGEFAQLIGSRLNTFNGRPGDHLGVTLYWQALGNSGDVAYTAFAHLLDSDNVVKAQQDHPPGSPDVPTTSWLAGEYVTDTYDLTIAADAKPGTYVVEIGLYNPTTGQRLPVTDGSGRVSGDRVVVGSFQVKS